MDNDDRNDVRRHYMRKNIESETENNSEQRSNGNIAVTEESGKQQLADTDRGTSAATVKKRVERLRHEFVNHMGDRFDDMMSDVMDELDSINKFDGMNVRRLDEREKLYCDKNRKAEKNGKLAEKQFLRRNSVLTDLYEINHFSAIYNFFIMELIILFFNTVLRDLFDTGATTVGAKLVMMGFAKFSIAIEIWLLMLVSTLAFYAAYSHWAQRRITMSQQSDILKAWDYGWILLFLAYQFSLIGLPTTAIVWTGLPPMSALVILSELFRMVMKIHAFVRSTAPIVLSYKPHSDSKELAFPQFNKFLYFMFAPTLIYRNSYPRTKEIRWRFALWHFTEVILVIFNMAIVFERTLLPPFEEFGKHPFDVRTFVLTVNNTWLPGILIYISGFYCVLHAWMNAAAEVVTFGDRLFYKDWWNVTNHADFYPRWNVVVHDWLYTYIYKDLYEIVIPGYRRLSIFAVFFVSAIVHEYILAFTFGFFFPVMFMMFGVIGFTLVALPKTRHTIGNVFLWFSLSTGSGLMICLYTMEYYARVNCPQIRDSFTDLFIPRAFFCFQDQEVTIN